MFYYNDYDFDPNKKYLIYFRGCFSPVTRGHFSLIEKYIDYPNVRYFVHQIGRRHGIPYEVNRKIFKIYLSYIDNKRIDLRKMGSSLEVLDYVRDADVVIFIKGNESFSRKDEKKQETFLKERYSELISQLEVPLDFLLLDRPKLKTLSATKFVESLQQNKNLSYFVPKCLSKKDFKYVIRLLKKYV